MRTWYSRLTPPAPSLVVPPACLGTHASATAWFTAGWDLCMGFDLAGFGIFRYFLFRCAAQSGNVQCSVVRFTGMGDTPTFEMVASSGIVPCPAVGDVRMDLGSFEVPPGRYGLSIWFDNTTAQVHHGSQQRTRSLRQSRHLVNGVSTGVPGVGTAHGLTNRWADVALEGDI